jgi:DNA-directed RNA polymerase specialized sigma24 family protein
MESEGSVTDWVGRLRDGDSAAAGKLWEAYYARMVALAKRKLTGAAVRGGDEEDVALSAFKSFCLAAAGGRFPAVIDRDNLWALLFALTSRKAVDLVRHERRKKRSASDTGRDLVHPDEVAARGLPPDFAAQLSDELRRLLDALGDDTLRSVAVMKIEGFTSAEIAAKLGCAERTVRRKLEVIRWLWREEAGGGNETED